MRSLLRSAFFRLRPSRNLRRPLSAALIWRRGTARGAIAGMTAGILIWGYTLLLPSLSDASSVGERILADGPLGLAFLRPQALFGLDLPPLVHGVLLSLALNIACYVGCSFGRRPTSIERVQADVFVPSTLAPMLSPMAPSFRLRRASVTIEELIATVARYLGEERTRESFMSFADFTPHQLRSAGRSRFPVAAIRRVSLGVGNRRGFVAARAVVAAAQAHGIDQSGAEAARRRQRGDPLQPRDFADRARPCPPRHRGVRQGTQSGLLEPAVRRDFRSAARPHAHRHRARRNSALRRRSTATTNDIDAFIAERLANTPPQSSRSSNASPSADW